MLAFRSITSRLATVLLLAIAAAPAASQIPKREGCNLARLPGVVWWGTDTTLAFDRLAAYAAPIFWFSPDEPLIQGQEGPAIRVPEPLPGGDSVDHPVVYYQVEQALSRSAALVPGFTLDSTNRGASTLNLARTQALQISYLAYFPTEAGLGAHDHDIEPVEMKLLVVRSDSKTVRELAGSDCKAGRYILAVTRVTGKAHGLVWFWNVLNVDEFTVFPTTLLVEEGKHALATDKNGDGYFTKGYDVNVRVNDAWGVRDIMRTGMLFSGGYESYMTKVRRPEHRVLPPLPDDSPLRRGLAARTARQPAAVYELRQFPGLEAAHDDPQLIKLMHEKVRARPDSGSVNDIKQVRSFVEEGALVKSLGVSYRADGNSGISFSFPFFVVKHLQDPMTGGYIVQRMYFRGPNLRDFGWMGLYTPSASRWIDTYLAAGGERAAEDLPGGGVSKEWHFVFETGLKFRVNVEESPFKFLGHLTPYWGLRMGLQNRGFFDIDRLRYVIEVGAGSF